MIIAGRMSVLIVIVSLYILSYFFIRRVKEGDLPQIRKIEGLDAITEAVGRATEMGAPVLFTPGYCSRGLSGTGAPDIIVSMSVLEHCSEVAERMGAHLMTTICQPDVFLLAKDAYKTGLLKGGGVDTYDRVQKDVTFISSEQFSYVTGTLGLMEREKVAANIFIGPYAAEALMFGEQGSRLGAINIGGTASTWQLPFFIATCNYTIIGEEMYAMGAYLTKNPAQLGTIMAEDYSKLAMILILISGFILSNLGFPIIEQILGM